MACPASGFLLLAPVGPAPSPLLLADGELQFKEDFVKQGLEGGKKAAYALRSAIADRVSEYGQDVEIVVEVVANHTGLSKALHRDSCIDSPATLKEFTLGFTQAQATFDFVDVGYGKERADSKITGGTPKHSVRGWGE